MTHLSQQAEGVRGSWMATAYTYSSYNSSKLNIPFNKDETLTFA